VAEVQADPLETAMSWEQFGHLISQRHTKLKPLLMDQKFLAGIGNIYSDEILWGAGLRWDRPSDSLSSQEVRRLYRSMVEVLQDAVKYRGSSLADEQYVDLFGRPGKDAAVSVAQFNTRVAPPDTRWHYASSETEILGLILRAVTGKPVADYLSEKIWQRIGTEADAGTEEADTGTEAETGVLVADAWASR